jgi:hypothetical protein
MVSAYLSHENANTPGLGGIDNAYNAYADVSGKE